MLDRRPAAAARGDIAPPGSARRGPCAECLSRSPALIQRRVRASSRSSRRRAASSCRSRPARSSRSACRSIRFTRNVAVSVASRSALANRPGDGGVGLPSHSHNSCRSSVIDSTGRTPPCPTQRTSVALKGPEAYSPTMSGMRLVSGRAPARASTNPPAPTRGTARHPSQGPWRSHRPDCAVQADDTPCVLLL